MTSPVPETMKRVLAVGDGQHRLQPAQHPVGAPVLGQLDGGARRGCRDTPRAWPRSARTARRRRPRRRRSPRPRGRGSSLRTLRASAFTTVCPERHLPVPADGHLTAVAHAEHGRRVETSVAGIRVGLARWARGCAGVVDAGMSCSRGDVRVALGGGQPAVPQELLDHTEVGPAVEQVRGEGVAQRVRAHPPEMPAARAERRTIVCDRPHAEPTAARVHEQRRRRARPRRPSQASSARAAWSP